MDEVLTFLAARIEEDRRASADTGAVDSHLRLLGSVETLTPIPPAIDPGQAEQTRHPAPRLLH